MIYLLILLIMRNVSDIFQIYQLWFQTNFVDKIKTDILCSKTFCFLKIVPFVRCGKTW